MANSVHPAQTLLSVEFDLNVNGLLKPVYLNIKGKYAGTYTKCLGQYTDDVKIILMKLI